MKRTKHRSEELTALSPSEPAANGYTQNIETLGRDRWPISDEIYTSMEKTMSNILADPSRRRLHKTAARLLEQTREAIARRSKR